MSSTLDRYPPTYYSSEDTPATQPPRYTSRANSVAGSSRAADVQSIRNPLRSALASPPAGDDIFEDVDWRQYGPRLKRPSELKPGLAMKSSRYRPEANDPVPTVGFSRQPLLGAAKKPVKEALFWPEPAPRTPMIPFDMYDGEAVGTVATRQSSACRRLLYGVAGALIVAAVVVGAVLGTRTSHHDDAAGVAGVVASSTARTSSASASRASTSPAPTQSPVFTGLAPGVYQVALTNVIDNCTSNDWGFKCKDAYVTNLTFSGTANTYQAQNSIGQNTLRLQSQRSPTQFTLVSPTEPVKTHSGCYFSDIAAFDIRLTSPGGFTVVQTSTLNNNFTGICPDVLQRVTRIGELSCQCTFQGSSQAVA